MWVFFVILIILIPIVFIITYILNIISLCSKDNKASYIQQNNNNDGIILEHKIKQYIFDFNRREFLGSGYKIFCDIQKALTNSKLEDVRNLMTDELFTILESQLSPLKVEDEQNTIKDYFLIDNYLKDFTVQNGTITISTVYIMDVFYYIVEQATGKTIRDKSKRSIRVKYEMKFRKTLDEDEEIKKCPNCGSPVKADGSDTCEYCNTVFALENKKWILTEMTVIK